MHEQSTKILTRFEHLHDQHGIAAGVDYLEGIKAELQAVLTDVNQAISAAQNQAVTAGLGRFVYDKPQERVPSKEKFIELFGIETFNQVKTLTRGKRVFIWNGKEF